MTTRILQGNCLKVLPTLAAESFHCVVTSPPYWALRDYGTAPLEWPAIDYAPMAGLPACVHVPAMRCSLGLEPSVEAFIGHMLLIFREVRRVLREDGTVWVNMGDNFAGTRDPKAKHSKTITGTKAGVSADAARAMVESRRRDRTSIPRSDIQVPGLKNKDMVGQPWRLALALQADGWWLRRDIIWHKRNPMPESCKDRPTTSHEYLFLLAKSESYYYDAEAIKEPASPDTHARYARGRSKDHKHAGVAAVPGATPQTIAQGFEHMRKPVAGWASGAGSHTAREHNSELRLVSAATDGKSARMGRAPGWRAAQGNGVGWGHGTDAEQRGRGRVKVAQAGTGIKSNTSFDAAMRDMPGTRNKRSVWSMSTEPFRGAHFATFPTELVKPCVLAGCPIGGTVLDIFGGSGTTGMVADQLGRNAVLVELNPKYVKLARRRLTEHAPLLAGVLIEDTGT